MCSARTPLPYPPESQVPHGTRRPFRVGPRWFALDRPAIVAILNTTPDSFFDGGRYGTVDAALRHAERCVDDGADILDIGGESTRPGARAPTADEERSRVLPVVEALVTRGFPLPLSIDTSRLEVLGPCLDAGARMWNDVRGARAPGGLARVLAVDGAVVIMHMRGEPDSMGALVAYDSVVDDTIAELVDPVRAAATAGLGAECVLVDPGIGFAKTADQSVAALRRLREFAALGHPLYVGASRKSFLGRRFGQEGEDRLWGSLGVAAAVTVSGASALRIHDVRATRKMIDVFCALSEGAP